MPTPVRYEARPVGVLDRTTGLEVLPTDPEWAEYEAWLAEGNMPDPIPPPPQPYPPGAVRFDFVTAGENRRNRELARIAEKDPMEALLRKAGIK